MKPNPAASIWTGSHAVLNSDPLQITYVCVLADERIEDMSPFQGFGSGWDDLRWALPLLARLPGSIVERSLPRDGLISMRMGGMASLFWLPLSISALERLAVDDLGFALVLLAGVDEVAERISAWSKVQPRPTLLLKAPASEDSLASVDAAVRDYCRSLMERHRNELSTERRDAASIALDRWPDFSPERLDIPWHIHNASGVNELVLARAGYEAPDAEPFVGRAEAEYDDLVLGAAEEVMRKRADAGLRTFNRIYLPRPSMVLTEPALFRFAYGRRRIGDAAERHANTVIRLFQRQRGLFTQVGKDILTAMQDPLAQLVVRSRQAELNLHCAAVGLDAATTTSAVVRLRPAVNHVFPTLSRLARNARANGVEARRKTQRLFGDVQRELAEAVGDARLQFIERHGGPIRIVSDSPLELLPAGSLPLALRYDTSRLPATPGNFLVGELAHKPTVIVAPEELCRVLVVTAFKKDDRLRNLVTKAVETIRPQLGGRVAVRMVRVETEEEFVAAVNAADEPILVFDGHGVIDTGDGVGGIDIAGHPVSTWHLRGRLRSPPIVILSACDTQGLDAPSHVTIGTGFLACGARTVLATILPIGGVEGAVFISRLLYRLADFIPAALKARRRAVNWCEIAAGMLRMVLASETVDALIRPSPDRDGAGEQIKLRANYELNMDRPDWYEAMLARLVEATGLPEKDVARKARIALATGEAVRYVQLGHPETIIIDDGSISHDVVGLPLAPKSG